MFDLPGDTHTVRFRGPAAHREQVAAEIRDAVTRVLEEQDFVPADEVAEFECEIARLCDAREAIGCNSGTDALVLALMAIDVGPGDEVITTPFSYVAAASAIVRVGATPIFVDIEPETFNLDAARVEAAITPRTRAIVPVHLFGQCTHMEPLWRLAVRHGLHIVEDACQAIGATYRGRSAGVLGTLGCFGFHPSRTFGGAGDGGLVTTDDRDIARRVRRLCGPGDLGDGRHTEIGLDSRLDAIQAAVLRVKARHLPAWTEARRANAARYAERFAAHKITSHVDLPVVRYGHAFSQYVIRVDARHRDAVADALDQQGVGVSVPYRNPLHLQPCFESLGHEPGAFPTTERASREVLALPVHPDLTRREQDKIVTTIARALGGGTTRYVPARPAA